MGNSLVRSVFSGVVAACFAVSAVTFGAQPVCSTAAHDSPTHGHTTFHGQSHSGQLPDAPQCAVHLCCANLATPVLVTIEIGRSLAAEQADGFALLASVAGSRAAHLLPFAHAPPLASV
jgi:hypothetical protein